MWRTLQPDRQVCAIFFKHLLRRNKSSASLTDNHCDAWLSWWSTSYMHNVSNYWPSQNQNGVYVKLSTLGHSQMTINWTRRLQNTLVFFFSSFGGQHQKADERCHCLISTCHCQIRPNFWWQLRVVHPKCVTSDSLTRQPARKTVWENLAKSQINLTLQCWMNYFPRTYRVPKQNARF